MKRFPNVLLAGAFVLSAAAGCGDREINGAKIPDGYVKAGNYLFAEDVEKEGYFYNYCPSILQVDENTRYVYYCANEKMNVVVDCIAFRKGVRIEDEWYYGPKSYVITPDSRQNGTTNTTAIPRWSWGNLPTKGKRTDT